MAETKKTILIAEDEAPIRGAMVIKFKNEGFNVIEAKNGQEALDLSLEKHPDIIVMDVIMPKKHGIEAVEEIRATEWGREVSILFVTNLSNDPKVEKIAASDKNCDYIVKSNIKLDELVEKVRSKL